MKKSLLLIITTLALVACEKTPVVDSEEIAVQKAVTASLKDPDSAKFGKFTLVSEKDACITVNAKNGFGGYTGDQQAYLVKQNGTWSTLMINEMSHANCVGILAKH